MTHKKSNIFQILAVYFSKKDNYNNFKQILNFVIKNNDEIRKLILKEFKYTKTVSSFDVIYFIDKNCISINNFYEIKSFFNVENLPSQNNTQNSINWLNHYLMNFAEIKNFKGGYYVTNIKSLITMLIMSNIGYNCNNSNQFIFLVGYDHSDDHINTEGSS